MLRTPLRMRYTTPLHAFRAWHAGGERTEVEGLESGETQHL